MKPCVEPIDCKWQDWSEWTSCTETCAPKAAFGKQRKKSNSGGLLSGIFGGRRLGAGASGEDLDRGSDLEDAEADSKAQQGHAAAEEAKDEAQAEEVDEGWEDVNPPGTPKAQRQYLIDADRGAYFQGTRERTRGIDTMPENGGKGCLDVPEANMPDYLEK